VFGGSRRDATSGDNYNPGPRNVKIGGDFDNVATGNVLTGFLTYALLFLVTYLPTYLCA